MKKLSNGMAVWMWLSALLPLVYLICAADLYGAQQDAPSRLAPELQPIGTSDPAWETPSETETFMEKAVTFEKAMADTHDRIEKTILDQAITLDNFFGNAAAEDHKETEYELRWRNSIKIKENGSFRYGTTVRANVVLSKINERLRLSVYGDKEATESTQSLAEDPGNPGFDRTESPRGRLVNTELRYQFFRTPLTDFFIGTGVRITLPLEAFVRTRFSHIHRLNDISLVRFAETVFVNDFENTGETTELSFDHLLNPKTLLRLAASGTLSRDIEGLEWGSELSLIRELSPKSAVNLTGGIHGNTHLGPEIGNYEVFIRYRRNFLRPWLFYEFEPQISWPRDQNGGYSPDFSCVIRLEILFQGAGRIMGQ